MTRRALLTPLPASGFRRIPWKNGGGVSIDIAGAYGQDEAPASSQGAIWRLGRTAIVAPGPFSDLAGYERLQVVVAGRGLVLLTPDGEIDLREPLRPVRYDGGLAITTRLEDGPVEVVNLIARRDACEIALRALGRGERTELPAGLHLLHAFAGEAAGEAAGEPFAIAAGDALRLDAEEPCLLAIAAGTALLATILRRTA